MSRSTRGLRGLLFLAGGMALSCLVSTRVNAVPAFSRKYQTSCQTCHSIFPKLNPFGTAFRLNGYHLPGETEEQVKQKPVSLGADAYARMWPEMVYPSTLPGDAPFALNVKMASLYASSHDESGNTIIHNDFQFPQEANLFAAGTLGKSFSFFGEVTYEESPDGSGAVELEHVRLDLISAFGPEHLFNFRIGKLAPNLYDGFQEMWLMTNNGADNIFTYNPIGFNGGTGLAEEGGGVSLPARTRAIEMYGVAAHRLFYTVGVSSPIGPGGSSGQFNNGSSKDFYARVDYKFGGLGLDGDSTGVKLPPENWRETSFRLGAFGYWGDGGDVDFEITDPEGNPFKMRQGRFSRLGVYGSLYLGDLNLIGVAVHGSDDLSLRDDETGDEISRSTHTYDAWFAQADYVIAPPFQVSLRYENLRPADPSVDTQKVLNANFSFLVRANIKLMLEYRRDLHDSQNYQLATVLRAAF
ncbi:MAG TPA: hypothetical protein VHQ44_07095 [Thermoanaerobaculia bacterium]|nr:hypothetical protein [Thermoanaerobaculia bacterium]